MVFRQSPYAIHMWVSKLGAASFTIGYEISDDLPDGGSLVYGTAETLLAPVDLDTGSPRRLTAYERQVLSHFLEAG